MTVGVACDLLVSHTGLETMMPVVGQHPFRGLLERIWQQLSARRLSISSAMIGGRHSVHSMRLRRQLRLS